MVTGDNTVQVLGPDTDQEAAWQQLGMARMVDRVAAGYSATFLAYGQVGTKQKALSLDEMVYCYNCKLNYKILPI